MIVDLYFLGPHRYIQAAMEEAIQHIQIGLTEVSYLSAVKKNSRDLTAYKEISYLGSLTG